MSGSECGYLVVGILPVGMGAVGGWGFEAGCDPGDGFHTVEAGGVGGDVGSTVIWIVVGGLDNFVVVVLLVVFVRLVVVVILAVVVCIVLLLVVAIGSCFVGVVLGVVIVLGYVVVVLLVVIVCLGIVGILVGVVLLVVVSLIVAGIVSDLVAGVILLVDIVLCVVVVLLVVGDLLAVGLWRVGAGRVVVGEGFWKCDFVVRGELCGVVGNSSCWGIILVAFWILLFSFRNSDFKS